MSVNKSTSSFGSRSSSLIDDVKIQEKIVRGSINYIMPKGSWYPNPKLKSVFSAVFSGSPEPKKMSGIADLKGPGSIQMNGDFGNHRGPMSLNIQPVALQNDLSGLIDDQEMNQASSIKSAVKSQSGSKFSGAFKPFNPEMQQVPVFKIPS